MHEILWLGHLGCMESGQLPKQLLFGELQKTKTKTWHNVCSFEYDLHQRACPVLYELLCCIRYCENGSLKRIMLG